MYLSSLPTRGVSIFFLIFRSLFLVFVLLLQQSEGVGQEEEEEKREKREDVMGVELALRQLRRDFDNGVSAVKSSLDSFSSQLNSNTSSNGGGGGSGSLSGGIGGGIGGGLGGRASTSSPPSSSSSYSSSSVLARVRGREEEKASWDAGSNVAPFPRPSAKIRRKMEEETLEKKRTRNNNNSNNNSNNNGSGSAASSGEEEEKGGEVHTKGSAPATWILSYVRRGQHASRKQQQVEKGTLPFFSLIQNRGRMPPSSAAVEKEAHLEARERSGERKRRRPRRVFQLGRSALRFGVGTPVRGAAKVLSSVLVSPIRRTSRAVAGRRRGRHDAKRQRDRKFPPQICVGERDVNCKGQQELAGIGNRYFAIAKLYDFAMYLNRDSFSNSSLMKSRYIGKEPRDLVHPKSSYYDDIVRDQDTELSVVMITARNIPLKLISSEYEKILRRRLQKVGGGSERDDQGVSKVISIFSEDQFPPQFVEKGGIKKGTTLTFGKKGGVLSASCNGTALGSVNNPKVCSAFFDMYIGTEPVHEGARKSLGLSAIDMINSV